MTPAEHYAEAERALTRAADKPLGGEAEYYLAAAQVHATLALAGATLAGQSTRGVYLETAGALHDAMRLPNGGRQ
jgi:hypothetical protein